MGRNEIKLRRQIMSSGKIAQHRNYGELMARHEKEIKIKRVIKVFMYFLIIAFLVVLFLMVRSIQGKKQPGVKSTSSIIVDENLTAPNVIEG